MSIFDSLKPKWRHSDPEVRRSAIGGISDESLLARIAREDPDSEARKAAIERVLSQNVLFDVAQTARDERIRADAASRLSDPRWTARIAIADSSEAVRRAAVDATYDEGYLKSVAISGAEIATRLRALQKIESRSLLLEFVNSRIASTLQVGATELLTDPEELTQVAMNHPNGKVRSTAISRLSDKRLLKEVTRGARYYQTQKEAVVKLASEFGDSDEAVRLARESIDRDIAMTAVGLIDAPRLLEEAARNANVFEVRLEAIRRIDDPAMLESIYESASDGRVRSAVVTQVLSVDPNLEQLSKRGRLEIVAGLSEAEAVKLMHTASDADARLCAIQRVGDSDLLVAVALQDGDEQVRLSAAARIERVGALARLAREARDERVRLGAVGRLGKAAIKDVEACGVISEIVREEPLGAVADEARVWLREAEDRRALEDLIGRIEGSFSFAFGRPPPVDELKLAEAAKAVQIEDPERNQPMPINPMTPDDLRLLALRRQRELALQGLDAWSRVDS